MIRGSIVGHFGAVTQTTPDGAGPLVMLPALARVLWIEVVWRQDAVWIDAAFALTSLTVVAFAARPGALAVSGPALLHLARTTVGSVDAVRIVGAHASGSSGSARAMMRACSVARSSAVFTMY